LKVKVKLYGAFGDRFEQSQLELDLPEDATVQDAVEVLPVQDRLYLYIVRDGIRLDQDVLLRDGDELLIFPPVTGGRA